MVRYVCFTVVMVVIVITGLCRYWIREQSWKKPHISGKLLIDTSGDKDRWTLFFDDDLSDIEKMTQVVLSIERVE